MAKRGLETRLHDAHTGPRRTDCRQSRTDNRLPSRHFPDLGHEIPLALIIKTIAETKNETSKRGEMRNKVRASRKEETQMNEKILEKRA